MILELETRAPHETEAIGRKVAALLPPGAVVALFGELASGKTCFVRGIGAHLAPAATVHSPTFTVANEYGADPVLYHLDLYRLAGPAEVAELGCEDYFDPPGVTVIEWAERAGDLLPSRRLDVAFAHSGPTRRRIALTDHGLLPAHWCDALAVA